MIEIVQQKRDAESVVIGCANQLTMFSEMGGAMYVSAESPETAT